MSAFSKSFDATLAKCTCEQINHPGKTCLWFLGKNLRCVMPGCLQYFLPLILVKSLTVKTSSSVDNTKAHILSCRSPDESVDTFTA